MLKDNRQISKPGRNGDSTGAETKIQIEKKGFKRAEAAIYLGVAKVTIDRLTQRVCCTLRGRCGTRFIPETISTAFCGKPPSQSGNS